MELVRKVCRIAAPRDPHRRLVNVEGRKRGRGEGERSDAKHGDEAEQPADGKHAGTADPALMSVTEG